MGKKSTPEIPERYELEELLKYNTDLNRFDAVNPFGSQRWSTDEDGTWTMTQAPAPELEKMLNTQYDFVDRGPQSYESPMQLNSAFEQLSSNMMNKYGGAPNYSPNIPNSAPDDPASYAQDRSQPPQASIMPGEVPTQGPDTSAPPAPSGGGIDWAAGAEALTAAGGQPGLGEAAARIAEALRNRGGNG